MSAESIKKTPKFIIGVKSSKEVEKALSKSKNPAETIANYQMTRSLHTMFARAFGTTPSYAADDVTPTTTSSAVGTRRSGEKASTTTTTTTTKVASHIEPLETDSVLKFLGHLGVSQYEVNKRIGDELQKQLEDELRKVTSQGPLLHLLSSCWPYATANPEFRPILWAVLKQLGNQTPLQVLNALAERDPNTGQLKHADIFRPLPPLLKRLCWEADWKNKLPVDIENSLETNPKQYLKMIQSTLLYDNLNPPR